MSFFHIIIVWVIILLILIKIRDNQEYTDKRKFWFSRSSISFFVCLILLSLSVLWVNFSKTAKDIVAKPDAFTYTLFSTVDYQLLEKDFGNIDAHLQVLNKFYTSNNSDIGDYTLSQFYWDKSRADDSVYKDIGFWGQSNYAIQYGNFVEGLTLLKNVKNKKMPWYNYLKAKGLWQTGHHKEASAYFKLEHTLNPVLKELVAKDYIYFLAEQNEFDKAQSLMLQYNLQEDLSANVRDKIYIYNGNIFGYYTNVFQNIIERININALLPALFILLIWTFYLVWLDIFEREKIVYIILALIGGMLSAYLALFVYDCYKLVLNIGISNRFFNDLLYCIFGIGLLEELVKLIPVLLILKFTKAMDEPYDLLLFASLSALGFAFIENISYFLNYSESSIFTDRCLYSSVAHIIMSSTCIYGAIRAIYITKKRFWIQLAISLLIAACIHGTYDFFIFRGFTILFLLGYLMSIVMWTIMINNALNNSKFFSYKKAIQAQQVQMYLSISITILFCFEYINISYNQGVIYSNKYLTETLIRHGLLLFFFTSKISTFDLVRGFWHRISIDKNDENLDSMNKWNPFFLVMRFFYVNAINPQNYVGEKVQLASYQGNMNIIFQNVASIQGEIIDRPIIKNSNDKGIVFDDPKWFLIRLYKPLDLSIYDNNYLLIKFVDRSASLYKKSKNMVIIMGIPDLTLFTYGPVNKNMLSMIGIAQVSKI